MISDELCKDAVTNAEYGITNAEYGVGISFSSIPDYKWQLKMTDDYFIMQVTAPNWFHRKMQKLILGFEWRRM